MPDPAQQLQTLYMHGFDIDTFDRFPNAVGLIKGNCIALAQVDATGLKVIGQPGWHMGKVLGVLVEKAGRQVFQAKDELIEATPERLAELESFRRELHELMAARA